AVTGHGIPRLIARKLCARGDRSVRLERLKAEVTAWPDERSGAIDVARPLMDGQGLAGDIELEAVDRAVERGIAVLGVALDRRSSDPDAAQIRIQSLALQHALRRHFRSLALALGFRHCADRSVRRGGAIGRT